MKAGDRVSVNVETFCGECFFCKRGWVNNCTLPDGGWALGCRIDGMQAEYVRVPHADCGLTVIPDGVTDRQALLTGDILATGFWAAKIADIEEGADVLVAGAGPTGICSMLCARLKIRNASLSAILTMSDCVSCNNIILSRFRSVPRKSSTYCAPNALTEGRTA